LQSERALEQEGTLAWWEADARGRCAELGGPNATYIQIAGGGIICTDKRGRKLAQRGQR
jgi:hypothetical protein